MSKVIRIKGGPKVVNPAQSPRERATLETLWHFAHDDDSPVAKAKARRLLKTRAVKKGEG
jgi:hypothetical protein